MDSRKYQVFLLLVLVFPSISTQRDFVDEQYAEVSPEDRWVHKPPTPKEDADVRCSNVHPSAIDIGKRFYAILPYFDREHTNIDFLHKFRGTVHHMSLGEDMLDREAAFYAAALTPIVFMQRYRDVWCLMERFHRALRLYQISHPTEKRSSLKILQNLRGVNQKIRQFIMTLPRPQSRIKSFNLVDHDPLLDDVDLPDKKDIRFLKELVKNLG